jgi:hypothetical protein
LSLSWFFENRILIFFLASLSCFLLEKDGDEEKDGDVGSNATSSHPTEINSALIMRHVVRRFLQPLRMNVRDVVQFFQFFLLLEPHLLSPFSFFWSPFPFPIPCLPAPVPTEGGAGSRQGRGKKRGRG